MLHEKIIVCVDVTSGLPHCYLEYRFKEYGFENNDSSQSALARGDP